MKYQRTYASDYSTPNFLIETATLEFSLNPRETIVKSKLTIKQNHLTKHTNDLKLDGIDLTLLKIKINQQSLPASSYELTPNHLIIKDVPQNFTLETTVSICPEKNFHYTGLYLTKGNFCTQNEPHGFRHITYFIDRPDILTKITTTIVADREEYPVVLSNGNLVQEKEIENGKHRVTWQDPFPKPCYLFALVAGKFDAITDSYVTKLDKTVTLKIFTEGQYLNQCTHAMEALKKAMLWEERRFGLSYDLDLYQIVGIDDFNFGAMENKGLNIFNNKLLLATKDTATDDDFKNVSSVIAHEYFHNWTGNRVSCRDWFQIGLKEGLTTLREELFLEEEYGTTVGKIESIKFLRDKQFTEDAGPLAHPIRLSSYIAVDNFYTTTVYQKSAAVARMLVTMFGFTTFRNILSTFLAKFDGKPTTIEDFLATAAAITQQNLEQFKLWYDQRGTPRLKITDGIDEQQNYYVDITQIHPLATKDFYIPLVLELINGQGDSFCEKNLLVTKNEERFYLTKVTEKPTVTFYQNFSIPMEIDHSYDPDELLHIATYAKNPLNKWQASQKLLTTFLVASYQTQKPPSDLPPQLLELFKNALHSEELDKALLAHMLEIPSENQLINSWAKDIDMEKLHRVREQLKLALARALQADFLACYNENNSQAIYEVNKAAIAQRMLKNIALDYLAQLDSKEMLNIAINQLNQANNLTDLNAALAIIANSSLDERELLLSKYYQRWREQPNLFNRWLAINAAIKLKGNVERLKKLLSYPEVSLKNPNNVYALIRTFVTHNLVNFHAIDGSGYEFLREQIITIDDFNSSLAAATLATAWINNKKLNSTLESMLQRELFKIYQEPHLSTNLYEIISKRIDPAIS